MKRISARDVVSNFFMELDVEKRSDKARRQKQASEGRPDKEIMRQIHEIVYDVGYIYYGNVELIERLERTKSSAEHLLSQKVVTPKMEEGLVQLKTLIKKHRVAELEFIEGLANLDEISFHVFSAESLLKK